MKIGVIAPSSTDLPKRQWLNGGVLDASLPTI